MIEEMDTKTSQLQIRVSPGQKATLKRLAAEAGVSVSAYVLATVLPATHLEFDRQVKAVRVAPDRRKSLSDFRLYLSSIAAVDFATTTRDADLQAHSELLRNYVAALVEDEARTRGAPEPRWAELVDPPARPHFAWDLRSLRPHLLRGTPAALKRRNVFAALATPARPALAHTEELTRLGELSRALAALDVMAELCVVGGAVLVVAFRAKPPDRRMRSLFRETALIRAAAIRVAERADLSPDWMNDTARSLTASLRGLGGFYEDANLRVFSARPDYTLAIKVASSPIESAGVDGPRLRADVRYLLRLLDVHDPAQARALIDPFFNERQFPPDVDDQLIAALS